MVRIEEPLSPHLEIPALQRRVFEADGPALYFARTGTFPMVSNLYGNMSRLEYIFRDAIGPIRRAVDCGADPIATLSRFAEMRRRPSLCELVSLFGSAWYGRPKRVRRAPVLAEETTLDKLPRQVSWSLDGGPFITLPLVYTEAPNRPGMMRSNLGMYRVQIGGNDYENNREAGLHYQLHRGIAAHHAAALDRGESLPVNIFVGGAPAMTLAAVMPLPQDVPELVFAGMLGRHRIPMVASVGGLPVLPIYAEADFCIRGRLDPFVLKREGPFGDHLGYYSLGHDFPVLHVEKVYHRADAIWPFTVVGRPPQEDSMFGRFIHELVGKAVPKKLPGVHAVRAVDEAGVHPLCLALGTEQYEPYKPRRAAQLHTLAHAILGFGQLSLAKYLFLAAREDDPDLDVENTVAFFRHVLCRVDWRHDLHFVTETTADTLDYTGGVPGRGSKLAVTVCGDPVRKLGVSFDDMPDLPNCFRSPRIALPGVLVVEPSASHRDTPSFESLLRETTLRKGPSPEDMPFPLIVLVDESDFAASSLRNFLWTTFTKSDPACDVHGFGAFVENKHWGCTGSLLIDARRKSHHPPELEEEPEITRCVDEKIGRLAAPRGPLHGVF